MKIAVFGATGKTGMNVVALALEAGHEVNAFVRDPAKMTIKHEKLTLVPGDVLDPQSVDNCIKGVDAVIVALGGKSDAQPMMLANGTKNILTSMKNNGVKRIIVMSSYPMSGSPEGMVFLAGTPPDTMKMMQPAIDDKIAQEEAVRESGLDWTIVRPLILTDGAKTGQYRAGESLEVKKTDTIARADVADFMLKVVSDQSVFRKTVTLAY